MVRWGILGCGSIARAFASAVNATVDAKLAAVGSRTSEKAQSFATENKSEKSYGTYAELVADPDVDAIYVATPHPMHCEDTLLALEAGKHVLCEKPIAINASEARRMAEKAREKDLFLMEAMWTRCFPIMHRVREILASDAIGSVRVVSADFGFRASFSPESRLFKPELGGGAMLDVGVYAISFASMVLGKPSEIASMMKPAPTGVDGQSSFTLGYPDGAMAVLYSSIETTTPMEATILGEKGSIRIHSPFWKPSALSLNVDGNEEKIELPYPGNGYQFEVQEVGRCLSEGLTESPVMPLAETIEIIETMDEIRSQWGLRYPGE